jgi:parallel beta-helix repeat protein
MISKKKRCLALAIVLVAWSARVGFPESGSGAAARAKVTRQEEQTMAAAPDSRLVGGRKMVPVDVLKSFGHGKIFSSVTISSAIASFAGQKRATLLLAAGTWTVDADCFVPSNITLKVQKGAVLSVSPGSRLSIAGSLSAGPYRIFSGGGQVLFGKSWQDVYPGWWKNADDGLYNQAIQKALASGARSLYFPEGTYEVAIRDQKPLMLHGDLRLHGQGGKTVLKVVEAPKTKGEWSGNDLFAGNDIQNVEISGITFDAEKFYPDPETTSRLDPSIRGTRALKLSHVNNCKIAGCRFQGFTNGSAYLTGNNLVLDKNSFYHGSYRTQTVRLDGSMIVTVSDNTFDDNGPHHYMVPGRAYETASTDALMVGYHAENAYIVNNRISNSSGCGIRVEMSKQVQLIGNTINEVGQDGITFYLKDQDSSCIGNTISNWGKMGNFGYLRRQKGKIYNPREYHYRAPLAPQLPRILDKAAGWEPNRYYLQGRGEASVPEYDPNDYENARAFRGFSGISVTDGSRNITIVGNKVTGNTSKTGALFNYASNYGINVGVHNANPPTVSGNCVIANNTVSGCIDYDLYCPRYVDPTSKEGVALPSTLHGNSYSKLMFYYQAK